MHHLASIVVRQKCRQKNFNDYISSCLKEFSVLVLNVTFNVRWTNIIDFRSVRSGWFSFAWCSATFGTIPLFDTHISIVYIHDLHIILSFFKAGGSEQCELAAVLLQHFNWFANNFATISWSSCNTDWIFYQASKSIVTYILKFKFSNFLYW